MNRLAAAAVALVACHSARDPTVHETRTLAPELGASVDSSFDDAGPDAGPDVDLRDAVGPYEAVMLEGRPVWWAVPWRKDETRLIAHLHGQCAPPVYSCGQWLDAGAARGFVVCPTGNEHCTSPIGPAMWDESFTLMDQDLERAISIAAKKTDGGFTRDGAVLTGFSRGGWAAIELVRMHPGADAPVPVVAGDHQLGHHPRVLAFGANGCAVLAIERDVEHRPQFGLQGQALAHARLDPAVVVAHGQRRCGITFFEQRVARQDGSAHVR